MREYETLRRSAGRWEFGPDETIELSDDDAAILIGASAVRLKGELPSATSLPADDTESGGGPPPETDDRLLSSLPIDAKVIGLLATAGILTVQHALDYDGDPANEGGLKAIHDVGPKTRAEILKVISGE